MRCLVVPPAGGSCVSTPSVYVPGSNKAAYIVGVVVCIVVLVFLAGLLVYYRSVQLQGVAWWRERSAAYVVGRGKRGLRGGEREARLTWWGEGSAAGRSSSLWTQSRSRSFVFG